MGTFDRLNQLNQRKEISSADKPRRTSAAHPPEKTKVTSPPLQAKSTPTPSPSKHKEETRRFTITVSKRQMKQVVQARAKLEIEKGESLTKSDVIRLALDYFISNQ